MSLRQADIVFVHGRSWLSRVIEFFERDPGESASRVSHVALAMGTQWIVEALGRGVVSRAIPRHYAYAVYRCKHLTPDERDRICAKAGTYVGRSYGWGKIILHALDWCLGGARVFRRLAFVDGLPICSWVVARSYQSIGIAFGVDAEAASPDDLWDHCLAHPERFERVQLKP